MSLTISCTNPVNASQGQVTVTVTSTDPRAGLSDHTAGVMDVYLWFGATGDTPAIGSAMLCQKDPNDPSKYTYNVSIFGMVGTQKKLHAYDERKVIDESGDTTLTIN